MASSDENLDLAQLYALLEQSGRESEFPDLLRKASDQAASDLVANLKRRTPRMLRQHRRMRRRFERRLVRRWRKALRLYEMVMVAASEAGADFNQEHRPSAAEENDFVFEALVVIHARASRIASEVFALLRTGHADGAHTRWRTLHELAVVAYVISEHGEEVAERYLLHHLVQNEKDARTYKSNSAMLGQTPFSDEEMQEIEQGAQAVVDRFGSEYKRDYGWAAKLTASGKAPNFIQLEQIGGLDHLRPFYGWASHQIHADSKGAYLNAVQRGQETMLIAGPTNAGLADPGHSSLISLVQITTTLLIHGRGGKPQDAMDLVIATALLSLVDEAGDAFLQAHEQLEDDERRFLQASSAPDQKA